MSDKKRAKRKNRRHHKDRRRRQELGYRRRRIRDIIVPITECSTDGLAVPILDDGKRATPDHPRWSRYCVPAGLRLWSSASVGYIVKPWSNLSNEDLDCLEGWNWAPNKPKSALLLLAGCADSFS